jgi:hypothetical protein
VVVEREEVWIKDSNEWTVLIQRVEMRLEDH